MKIYGEFTYTDGKSTFYKPVFIEDDEEWKAYAKFNRLENELVENYILLDSDGPEIVNPQNEEILKERAAAIARAFEGKETFLLDHGIAG